MQITSNLYNKEVTWEKDAAINWNKFGRKSGKKMNTSVVRLLIVQILSETPNWEKAW